MAEPNILAPGSIWWPNVNANNYLSVPDLIDIDMSAGFTLIFTVRAPQWAAAANADVIIAQRSGSTEAWWDIRFNGTEALQVFFSEGVGNVATTAVGGATISQLATDEWHTIAITFQPSVDGKRRCFGYLHDGSGWNVIGTPSVAGDAITIAPSTVPLSIGAHSGGANGLNGKELQRVALYEGTNGDLPGGELVFEFDGTELDDPTAASITSKSGHTVSVSRNVSTPLVITPRKATYSITPDPGYIEFPGPTGPGNRLHVHNGESTNVPGDISFVAKVALNDWAYNDYGNVASRWDAGMNTWIFRTAFGGRVGLAAASVPTAAADINVTSTVITPLPAPGEVRWIGATLDLDNGAGGSDVRFWQSLDGEDWTQVGPTIVGTLMPQLSQTTRPLSIGERQGSGNTHPLPGRIYYVAVIDGIGPGGTIGTGPRLFEIDGSEFTDPAAESFTARSGQNVVINRGEPSLTLSPPIFHAYFGGKPVWGGYIDGEFVSEVPEDLLRGAAA